MHAFSLQEEKELQEAKAGLAKKIDEMNQYSEKYTRDVCFVCCLYACFLCVYVCMDGWMDACIYV